MANFNANSSYSGLGTFTVCGCPSADVYVIQGTLALPSITKGDSANSSVVCVIKQNSSTVYTGLAGAEGFRTSINAAANDIISIVLSSANAVDQNPNSVHMTVSVYEGGE